MPRILRILNRLAVGGPVLNATYLTKYMAPEFETLLVVGEKEDHEKSAEYLADALGIQYTTIKGMGRSVNPANDYIAYQKLRKLIKEYKPDIVHTHAAKPGALGRMAASAAKVPVILHTFHGHVFHSYFNSVKSNFFIQTERLLAKKSDAIIAISQQQKKELAEQFKIAPEEKIKVIPLGFDLDRFQNNREEKRAHFRTEFGVKQDEIAIGIIGRLVPVKNHYLFLKAINHVLSNSNKKIKAFIIGDGETRQDLENIARESNMNFSTEKDPEHLHPLVFTSWRSDIDFINAGLDIVCLTSFNEGTPVSLIEAQAANKPIVSTRVGGIADIIVEGETGLLSDVQDAEGFSNHLLNLVEDDALRMRLGESSSKYVMEKFTYQRLVRDMSGLYYELLEKKESMLFFKKKNTSLDLSWLHADMHSHLIPGIDDGAPDIETSIQLIEGLVKLGYKKIITTPHILWEMYPNTPDKIADGIEILKQEVYKRGIQVELAAAAEYFIDEHFEQHLKTKQPLLTISENLVLVEFSMINAPMDLQEVIFEMQMQNYVPVIAHPERYTYLRRKPAFLEELKNSGCLFQLNLLALTGYYGDSVLECAEFLLKNEYYELAGTDLHNARHLTSLEKLSNAPLYKKLQLLPLKNSSL